MPHNKHVIFKLTLQLSSQNFYFLFYGARLISELNL
jgi:hypothetical protein